MEEYSRSIVSLMTPKVPILFPLILSTPIIHLMSTSISSPLSLHSLVLLSQSISQIQFSLTPNSFLLAHSPSKNIHLYNVFHYHYPQYLNVSLISSISSFSISFIGYPWIHMPDPNTICFETSFDFEIINLYILFLLSIHRRYSFALHITDSIHPKYFNDVICSLSILDISFFTILLFIFP